MLYYDLKQEAQRKTIGDVAARENELIRIGRTLHRQYNNNIIVHGQSGVGKSALLEGFAYRASANHLSGFSEYNLVKIESNDLKRLMNSLTNQETLNHIITGFRKIPGESLVIIDDFQNVIPENRSADLNLIFESFTERSDISLLLGISEEGYQKLLQSNSNFLQNFEDLYLKENDTIECQEILSALIPAFENEYKIKIPKSNVKKIIEYSSKINSDKKMPLRSIHYLDECLAYAKINKTTELSSLEIQEIFAEKTGVPSSNLNQSDALFLAGLEENLNSNVIGQKNAVRIVSNIIRRSRMGLRNPHRPYGSFLFLGPSGVGKTELSKTLAKTVYGSERAFARIDMSEFGEPHTVQRLIGAPPGYIGYEAGGQLTNAVKEQPYSLILLDEIEKANPKIFDIFLQVFEDGRLTDGQGQTANFSNSILIATSNLGIPEIILAFKNNTGLDDPIFLEEKMIPILLKHFRTEFLNRFDAIIIFNPLAQNDLLKIALLEINKIEKRTSEHNIKFNIDPTILKKKISELTNDKFGARPIKRFIEQTCENLIAAKIMQSTQKGKV